MLKGFGVIVCGLLCLLYRSSGTRTGATSRVHRFSQCRNGVQYDGLGCFTLDTPFSNTNWLPQSPSAIGLSFLLYTRSNPVIPDVLSAVNRSSINDSHFNPRFPVKFIVHGFLQYAGMDFVANMTNALLTNAPTNVIVISWGDGAGFPYSRAVANTRVVGAATAQLINALREGKGITARQIHIIGHSLGAHVGGYTGSAIPNLGRITGLDPAQPGFSGYAEPVRLDQSDARFVDVIHSDALPYDTVQGYGIIEPLGHVDFYPNGGHHQPGCHEDTSVLDFLEDAVRNGVTTAEVSLSCSHERSTELFTSSVILSSSTSSCSFYAFPCQSEDRYMRGECLSCENHPCPILGLDADMSFRQRGVFYLSTTDSSPFCGQHYFVALSLGHNMNFTDGIVSIRLQGMSGRQLNWRPIKEGQISGGERITSLFVDESDIGEISQMDVRFLYRGNQLPWRASGLDLEKAEVDNVMRFPRKYFCHSSVTVPPDLEVTLTPGTYILSDCP